MSGGGGSSAADGGGSAAASEADLLRQLTLAAAEVADYSNALVGGVSIVELQLPKQEQGETVADIAQSASYQKELAEINSTYRHLSQHDERYKAAIRFLNNKYGIVIKEKVKGETNYKAPVVKKVEPKAKVDPIEATRVKCGCTQHPIYGFRPNPKLKDPFDLKTFNSKNIDNTLELIKGFCGHQLAFLVERGFIKDPKDLDTEKIFATCCHVQLCVNRFVLPPLPPPQADKWGKMPKAVPEPGPETFRGRILALEAAAAAEAAAAEAAAAEAAAAEAAAAEAATAAALEHDTSVSPLDCAACRQKPASSSSVPAAGGGGAEPARPNPLWSASEVANLSPEISKVATDALGLAVEGVAVVAVEALEEAAAEEEVGQISLPENFTTDAASANRFMANLKQPELLLLLATGVAPPDSSWNVLRDQCASHGLKEEFRRWRETKAVRAKKGNHPSLNIGGSRKGGKNVGFDY